MTTPAQAASAVLVSIGNSRSATARCGPGGALSEVRRLPSASLDLGALDPGPEPVHVIAVVEEVARRLTGAVRRAGREVTWWGVDREIPVRHPYAPPEAPGADRLVAALAAFDRAGGACVVVDAGTAVTVDVVGADGSFLGGAIAPGLVALRDGLRARAPARLRRPPIARRIRDGRPRPRSALASQPPFRARSASSSRRRSGSPATFPSS